MQQFTPDKEPLNPNRKKVSYAFLEIFQTILLAAAFYFAIDAVIDRVEVFNISMDPTVKQGEVIFVNKLAYRLGEVDRGDVVTFHYPDDPDYDYIKRAIGLPETRSGSPTERSMSMTSSSMNPTCRTIRQKGKAVGSFRRGSIL